MASRSAMRVLLLAWLFSGLAQLSYNNGYNDPQEERVVRAESIADVMGGATILGSRIRSVRDLERAISRGIPKRALRVTVERVYVSAGDVRRVMARIVPEATFKRRVRLSHAESERTERLARVIAAAEHAWSDQQDAREWLTRAHPELGRRAPLDLALTELGARQVEELLDRLFYGIPS
jgi:putative toxin-antitoxin system antitoxin component (TIGR02293 family)